jgi:hypothetical protein
VQDKVWVDDPDGAPWEIYTVIADADTDLSTVPRDVEPGMPGSACACGPAGCGPDDPIALETPAPLTLTAPSASGC